MINLISSLLVLLILLFGFLWGFIRGLKKTALRGAWLIVTIILSLLFTSLITQLVCNINISGLNIKIDGVVATTISNACELGINLALKQAGLSGFPLAQSLAQQLPFVILNPFVFVIVFWILKIILLPINSLVANLLFNKKQKNKNSTATKDNKIIVPAKKEKPKKQRLFGGLVGIAVGLVVCCATFVPVFGILDIANQLNEIKISVSTSQNENNSNNNFSNVNITQTQEENSSTQKEISLLEYLLNDNIKYLNELNSSVGLNVLKYTGVQALSNVQFSNLTTMTLNGTKVSLTTDIKEVASLSSDIITLTNFDTKHITKDSLSNVINATSSMLNKVKNISLFNIFTEQEISFICDYLLNEENSSLLPDTNNEFTNLALRTAISSLSNYNFNHIIEDLLNVVDIIKSTNDNNLLTPIINNEIQNLNEGLDFVASISEEWSNSVINSLFEIDIVNSVIPMSLEYGIEAFCNFCNIEYTEQPPMQLDVIKDFCKQAMKDVTNVAKTLDKLSSYYVTPASISNLGTLLDNIIKPYTIENESQYIISPSLLKQILDEAEIIILENDTLTNAFDQNLINTITPIIQNLSNINNYKVEFDKVASSFELIKPYIDFAMDSHTLDKAKQLNLSNLGKAIDTLNTTILLDNTAYTLYNYVIDKVVKNANINEVSLSTLASHLIIEDTANISYEIELEKLNNLYQQVLDLSNNLDVEQLILTDDFVLLGNNIQTLKTENLSQETTALFNVDVIISDLLELVSQMNVDNNTKQLLGDVKTEIDNTSNKSIIDYKIEFSHIKNAVTTLNNENNTINNYLNVTDDIINGNGELSASVILTRPLYNLIVKNIPSADEYSEQFIKNIITTLMSNIEIKSQQVNAKNEINCFIKLFNQIDNLQNLDENSLDFEQQLSEISNDIEYINTNSILLTNLKNETISQLFELVKENITDSNLISTLDTAKNDALNSNQTIYQIYQDILKIKDEFSSMDYAEDDITNTATLESINNKLKTVCNLASFTKNTTNAIYNIILTSLQNDFVTNFDSIDTSSLPQDKKEEIANYKQEILDLIANEKSALNSILDSDVLNDYYLTSLNNIKAKLDEKPTV